MWRHVRAQTVRQDLYDELVKLNGDKEWSFILRQLGMFSFTGLNPAQVCTLFTLLILSCWVVLTPGFGALLQGARCGAF